MNNLQHTTTNSNMRFPQDFYRGGAPQSKDYPGNFYTANIKQVQETPRDFPQGFYKLKRKESANDE